MTESQRLEVRRSEIRDSLNEFAALTDPLTEEQRAEVDSLRAEFTDTEAKWRAATVAEAAALDAADTDPAPSAEERERRALVDRASLGAYLDSAKSGTALRGPENELQDAYECRAVSGGVAIPWALLAHDGLADEALETRAATTRANLDGPTAQRPILRRLFGRDIMAALGVRIDSVPPGKTRWPLLTSGVAPTEKGEGVAADAAVAATFTTETLQPKRLTGRYEWTVEQAAEVRDVEQALRRDLGDAIRARMASQIINGDESADANQVSGFLETLTAPTAPAAVATYADYAASMAQSVDGLHASMEGEVGCVLGIETYRHAAGVFQAGSGEAGIEAIKRRGRACMASPFIPDPAGNVQTALYHGGRDAMRGDSVAAMWPTLEVIRDVYTRAAEGEIILTWIVLWDARTAFRSGAYRRAAYQLA